MSSYDQAFASLNEAQKQAVTTTEGPLLVIAGPGTGKTQLLSTRAAHIVAQGNVGPTNILCLTYTETGASEMRMRLGKIMGPAGGEVAVHTFHSFGTWLINQYPERFSDIRSLQTLDDLARYRIFEGLLAALPLRHALAIREADDRFIRQGGVIEAIRAFKQAGLVPSDVTKILKKNQTDLTRLQPLLDELFSSTLSAKRLPQIAETIASYTNGFTEDSVGALLLQTLAGAVTTSQKIGKTKPIGDWRSTHTEIKNGQRIFKSAARSELLRDVVKLYEQYQTILTQEGRYDYEDMVLWAAKTLSEVEDLRLEIAERYQYIMVDEYQDTNGSQNQLLDTILGANPINSPNIMVVGDDDQAIMRFQGAELSGLLQFIKRYNPAVVTLQQNYRSAQQILDASRQIMTQTTDRLEAALPELGLSKQLSANNEPTQVQLTYNLYASPIAEYYGIAEHIEQLIKQGTAPADIAIIGRKHKELITLTDYLTSRGIAITYDYRENILENTQVAELLQLASYIIALGENPKRAEQFLPSVLGAAYWQLQPLDTYQLAMQARQGEQSWLDAMLASDAWRAKAEWLLAAAAAVKTTNFTSALDVLLGRQALSTTELGRSPFAYYLELEDARTYVRLLSHLLTLREAVLAVNPHATSLQAMLDTVAEYRRSQLQLVDNNPLLRGDQAGVTLMSAHGAKGREFEHVIILSAIDTVWGNRARGHNQRISLPENLPLYPAGDNESDRLRLLYVAMTRAKSHLILAGYQQTDDGKLTVPLGYLQLGSEDGWWQPHLIETSNKAIVSALETAWKPAPSPTQQSLRSILEPALPSFRLSPTALRSFLDICYAGPKQAIEQSVLHFPSSYTASSALGQAAHQTLQQAQRAYANNEPLSHDDILQTFDRALDASGLPHPDLEAVRAHGHSFMPRFIGSFSASDFGAITATEQRLTATLPGDVPFSGVIDALIDTDSRLQVIDYKTGKPPLPNWETKGLSDGKKISLHFYRQQLICYKLLVEHSRTYSGKNVTAADLVFVEPPQDNPDDFVRLTINNFDASEVEHTIRLIQAVYHAITTAQLPDVSNYSPDLRGIQRFEEDLLNSMTK